MQHPDEGTIHAWLDGALSTEESAALESHVAACADCSAAVAEARGLVAASSRIVSALDVVPGGVIPARKPVSRPWYTSTQLRAAAAVLFIAGTSAILYRSRGEESLPDLSQRVMSDQALPVPAQAESDAARPRMRLRLERRGHRVRRRTARERQGAPLEQWRRRHKARLMSCSHLPPRHLPR